ncbi:hypothetical protein HY991_04265, partial [Candidatus Micrarchaeota archaeon]|nr:hypothetical protein [Candidatus Micrarchaeota archaeon]
ATSLKDSANATLAECEKLIKERKVNEADTVCDDAKTKVAGVETKSPDVHKKTLDAFKKKFVDSGNLDIELCQLLLAKASSLSS